MTKETVQLKSDLTAYKRSLQDRKRQIQVHNAARGTVDVEEALRQLKLC